MSNIQAQLFEDRLALNRGKILSRVSFSFVQKHFPDNYLYSYKSIQSTNVDEKNKIEFAS